MQARWAFWLLVLPVFLSGCATKTLVEGDSFREPWPGGYLQLALDQSRRDVLVVYDEMNNSDKPKPRAYYLFQNEKLIENRRKPAFVSPDKAGTLSPIPVYKTESEIENPTNLELYAVSSTNNTSFKLLSKNKNIGEFYLPVYKDGMYQMKKAFLLPLAVGADATIVGGYIAVQCLPGLAGTSVATGCH